MTDTVDDGSSPIFVKARDRLRSFAVGFVLLTVADGVMDGDCGGSGTLVEVDGQKCILTAAHVAIALEQHKGRVGIVLFPSNPLKMQRLEINMKYVRVRRLGDSPFGEFGPDIALLFLPFDTVSALSATNVFYSISRRIGRAKSDFPSFYCLAGVIHERTVEVVQSKIKGARAKVFNASFEPGTIQFIRSSDNFDLIKFTPQVDAGYVPPASYQGVSGAALWQVYCGNGKNDQQPEEIADILLVGVAFYETAERCGVRAIHCHGPESVLLIAASH